MQLAGLGLGLGLESRLVRGEIDVGLVSRSHDSLAKEREQGRCMKMLPHVPVFMTMELLNDESRAATSGEAAARRDDTRKSLGFGRGAEKSVNRTTNSRRSSASAGYGG